MKPEIWMFFLTLLFDGSKIAREFSLMSDRRRDWDETISLIKSLDWVLFKRR